VFSERLPRSATLLNIITAGLTVNVQPSANTVQGRKTVTRDSKVANMEGAFTHLGNHLISDSGAAIRAGADDLSTVDPDESLLFGRLGGRAGRRRADDEDNQTEVYDDDDDNESLSSVPVTGLKNLDLRGPEEERELPPHACAYVLPYLFLLDALCDY
jgi:hypothetical protein